MEIAVRVEPRVGQGFLASSPVAPDVRVEAATAELAVEQLQERLAELVASGQIISVKVPDAGTPHPWAAAFGMFKDNPLFPEVLQHMKAYREQRDRELDSLIDE